MTQNTTPSSSSTSNPFGSPSDRAWAVVELERRRDRSIRRICYAAWTVVFAIMLAYAAVQVGTVIETVRSAQPGELHWANFMFFLTPVIGMLIGVALPVAVLATIGIFLRFRTASMAEIQLRLASLEQVLTARADVA